MSNSLRPHGLQPTRFLCPRDSPGKNTGVGCHFLLQGISPTQESNPGLLHCRQILYRLSKIGASTKKERHFPTSVLFAQMHEGQSTQEVLELHMSGEATSSISATRSPLSRWSERKSRKEELPVEAMTQREAEAVKCTFPPKKCILFWVTGKKNFTLSLKWHFPSADDSSKGRFFFKVYSFIHSLSK